MVKWSDISDLFDDAVSILPEQFSNVVLDYDLPVTVAYTDDKKFPSVPLVFHIGAKEFNECANDYVSLGKAMSPIVNLFHETHGHGGQLLHEFNKTGALAGTFTFNYFACKSSLFYYGVDSALNPHEQYYKHPYEIAAQYVGIRDAFAFLSEEYDDAIATDMIKNYLLCRIAAESEFTPRSEFISSIRGCDTVNDILNRFDETFKLCAQARHLYKPSFSTDDCVHVCAKDIGKPWWPRQVATCKSGLMQDVMMTSALFTVDENYQYGRGLKPFEGMDLDAESVFKRFGRNSKMYVSDLENVDLSVLESYDTVDDMSLSSVDDFQV